MKLSIRSKFLFVMSGLLLVCLGFYLLMSITVFKSDKTQLVYDLNRSQVSNLASEIETRLQGVSDSLNLFAQLPKKQQQQMIDNLFDKETDIVSLQVYKGSGERPIQSFHHKNYMETYGLSVTEFQKNIEKQKFPFQEIVENGEAIWNSSFSGAPPFIGFGKLVVVLDEFQAPLEQWVLVAHLKVDSFVKSVSLLKLSEIQVSNINGDILVQRDAAELVAKPNMQGNTLFKKAISSEARLSVTRIEEGGKGWLSAFSKSYNGKLVVTARAPEEEVFKVVQALAVRTLLFGSIVLTLVILAAFLLSRSLTENIALLVKRMSSVSQGDLTTHIDLKGRDETVILGNTFNKMIVDLKQSRDELEVMNRELDQKVKDRTRELEIQNQKVAEAQEALLRTARLASMGEVAGRTAHEVLNPLTSLLTRAGLTQKRVEVNYREPLELLNEIGDAWDEDYKAGGFENLVKNWQEPSEVSPDMNLFLEDMQNIGQIKDSLQGQADAIAKDMKFIREEGDRIGKIIHGMRRLGNMKSEVRVQGMHKLLADCCYIMADLFDQHDFKIEKDFAAVDDSVKIDRDEFIQSVTNMMRNSMQSLIEARADKHIKTGHIKLSTLVESNKFVVFIEDNGMGVTSDNQQKLFQANFTTKSSDEGTGLGLSISRRFIRSYDGDINLVESVSYERTIFKIELPLDNSQQRKAVA